MRSPGGIAAELIKKRIQLVHRQQCHRVFIPGAQAVKGFIELMRILLDKSIGDFTNACVETIGGIQRAQIAFAKIVMKRGGQRECAPLKR
jgi:hypothetical protein